MKYLEFQKKFKDFPIISMADIRNVFPGFDQRRLYEWQKSGYIKKLANNFYVLADREPDMTDMGLVANKLYEPSYLSLEYALRHYNLIPEMIYLHTGVSTRKTKMIKTPIGNFSYRTIKPELFFGYRLIGQGSRHFKIAEIEKAILDFFYLRKDLRSEDDIEELRINPLEFKEQVNQTKLKKYLKKFGSRPLERTIKILLNQVKSYDKP